MILRWSSADLEMHQFGEAVWPMCSKDLQTGGSTYQLTQTDGDTHSKQWMELGESYGRTGGRIVASKGIGNLQEDQQSQLTQTLGAR